jgi:serine/threonine-protein kinase
MNQENASNPPEDEEPRTVFTPSPPAGDAPSEDRTIVSPAMSGDADRTIIAPSAPSSGTAPGVSVPPTSIPGFTSFAPRTDGQGIQVGDCLNHIFRVDRFLARGGMGEVFEGCNVNTDERVAIKVMLPALAADEKVVAMFRKEAKTMTRLHHEALVGYRVLAQEPQLGVLYIVTEFIDGVNLSDALGKIQPTEEELAGLLKRLASGLAVAHRLGAIHRDISPDNILLEGGDYHKAKVIDFGIAKDLDPSSKTIVGEGFAGKLNYVAPEQLGDFGREVGPWTDIYSLALVILAVVTGKNVKMGGSLVDAVDKRRAGPDLSPVPEKLRPVLEAMLRPDPKQRLRSMDDVVAMLDGTGSTARPATSLDGTIAPAPAKGGMSKGALVGAAAAAVAILGAGAWFAMNAGPGPEEQVQIARTAIDQALPAVECSWLQAADVKAGEPLSVRMTGVAGNPTGARYQIGHAIQGAGLTAATVNVEEVALIQPQGCSALQTFGKVRASGEQHLAVDQREFEMAKQPAGAQYAVASVAKVKFRPPSGKDLSLIGIEPNGELSELLPNRAALDEAVAAGIVTQLPTGEYQLSIDMDHTGWSGLVLLTGDGPFDKAITQPSLSARGPDWQNQFVAAASEREWKSEMLWFKSVDKQPN